MDTIAALPPLPRAFAHVSFGMVRMLALSLCVGRAFFSPSGSYCHTPLLPRSPSKLLQHPHPSPFNNLACPPFLFVAAALHTGRPLHVGARRAALSVQPHQRPRARCKPALIFSDLLDLDL